MTDWIKPDVILQLIAIIFGALSAYFAIKSDLRVMHEKLNATNRRVDDVERDMQHLIFGRRGHDEKS